MQSTPWRHAAALIALWLGLQGAAQAALVTTTQLGTFNTATVALGGATWVDFESAPPGGFSISAVTAAGSPASVRNQPLLWNPSGTHFLGTADAGNLDQFTGGDSLTFSFSSALQAFGLYVVTGGDAMPGDLVLSSGIDVLANGAQSDALSDGAGSYAYFMGFIATDSRDAFNSITLTSNGNFFYLFDVDDLRFSWAKRTNNLPEPGSMVLALMALALVSAVQSLRR